MDKFKIANKLQCRKVGYKQKGTMSVGIFDAESEDSVRFHR